MNLTFDVQTIGSGNTLVGVQVQLEGVDGTVLVYKREHFIVSTKNKVEIALTVSVPLTGGSLEMSTLDAPDFPVPREVVDRVMGDLKAIRIHTLMFEGQIVSM
eukprot:sb/3478177/